MEGTGYEGCPDRTARRLQLPELCDRRPRASAGNQPSAVPRPQELAPGRGHGFASACCTRRPCQWRTGRKRHGPAQRPDHEDNQGRNASATRARKSRSRMFAFARQGSPVDTSGKEDAPTGLDWKCLRPSLHPLRARFSVVCVPQQHAEYPREAAREPSRTSYDSEWRRYVENRVEDDRAGDNCPCV